MTVVALGDRRALSSSFYVEIFHPLAWYRTALSFRHRDLHAQDIARVCVVYMWLHIPSIRVCKVNDRTCPPTIRGMQNRWSVVGCQKGEIKEEDDMSCGPHRWRGKLLGQVSFNLCVYTPLILLNHDAHEAHQSSHLKSKGEKGSGNPRGMAWSGLMVVPTLAR
jgi:hypothetical protein